MPDYRSNRSTRSNSGQPSSRSARSAGGKGAAGTGRATSSGTRSSGASNRQTAGRSSGATSRSAAPKKQNTTKTGATPITKRGSAVKKTAAKKAPAKKSAPTKVRGYQNAGYAAEDRNGSLASYGSDRSGYAQAGGGMGAQGGGGVASRILAVLGVIFRGIWKVLKAIGRGIAAFFRFLSEKLPRGVSIAIKAVLALAIVAAVFFGVDAIRYRDKIFPNVSVGAVDVGGMAKEDAEKAIDAHYEPLVSNASLSIYTSESAQHRIEKDAEEEGGEFIRQDATISDAGGRTLGWTCTATNLDAFVPSKKLVEKALVVGRDDGGLLKRIGTMILGTKIDAMLDMSESALESIAYDVDSTIGEPREDSSVVIEGSTATAVAGHDGNIIDRDDLVARINAAFLSENPEEQKTGFVAQVSFAPQRITEDKAKATAERINKALENGAKLTYHGLSWTLDGSKIGDLTETSVVTKGGESDLAVTLNSAKANSEIITDIASVTGQDDLQVTFEKSASGDVVVHPTTTDGKMADVSRAASDLATALYGEGGLGQSAPESAPQIDVKQIDAPKSIGFQEALDAGIISLISTYTTEYSTGTEARDTRNYNIHLCADLINDTICKANGGQWNFNDTTGECNEAKGFKNAGIIQNGVYTDSYGGGICQVSTTVFNAAYEGGYPIPLRYNHTLYPDYYPAGRDAAVDYGGFNLIWENDTTSDVLLKTSYTENTLTVDLYGISPRLHVETETGDWIDGAGYGTKIYVDRDMPEGTDYISSQGENGGQLNVTRTVYNDANEVVRTDVFTSNYEPHDEVRILGDGTDAAQLVAAGAATYLTDEIRAHL